MSANTTFILGMAVLVFSIFGSAWLNLRQIERMIDSLRNEMKADKGELKAEMSSLGARVERIERQLDKAFNLTLK